MTGDLVMEAVPVGRKLFRSGHRSCPCGAEVVSPCRYRESGLDRFTKELSRIYQDQASAPAGHNML